MKTKIQSVLLVEGKDDQHVVWSLMEHYQVPEVFKVIDCDGIDNLLQELSLRLTTPTMHKSIGVVMDADVNLQARFDSFCSILSKTGKYDLSQMAPQAGGTVIAPVDENYPVIGLWLMPDNRSNGMLEDFVMTLADGDDELMKEADTVLNSIEAKKINRYTSVHRSKAKIHTFLAWQEEPGKPMGQAITAKVLDAEATSAKVFMEWTKQVFAI